MKARVKGTIDIIEVEFHKDALNACYPPYYDKEHGMYYQPEQLEWVDNEANAEPDYWTRLEHTYAGMAMQALIIDASYANNEGPKYLVEECITIARNLVNKMKEAK